MTEKHVKNKLRILEEKKKQNSSINTLEIEVPKRNFDRVIPFVPKLSEKIKNRLKKYNIKTVYNVLR